MNNKTYLNIADLMTIRLAIADKLATEYLKEDDNRLVCNINGNRKSVLDSIVSAKSEYRTIEQYMEFNETHMSWDGEKWVEDACLTWDDVLQEARDRDDDAMNERRAKLISEILELSRIEEDLNEFSTELLEEILEDIKK